MKRRARPLPPVELIRELLSYDARTGIFRWKRERRRGRHVLGKEAGSQNSKGYIEIGFNAFGFGTPMASRLAWVYVHGSLSEDMEIDHIDSNPLNNAIANLRLATSVEQNRNKRTPSTSKSGIKGAHYNPIGRQKKWRSEIRTNEGRKFLGHFHTAEEAHAAYCAAAKKYHGEFARTM